MPKRSSRLLRLCRLEGRLMPATFTVTNSADAGSGSLRQAVIDANLAAGPDDIVFDANIFSAPSTITLTTGQITIADPVNIAGPPATVALDANSASRVFYVDVPGKSGQSISIAGLTLTKGKITGADGGAILNVDEALTISNVIVSNCVTDKRGGAISVSSVSGTLTAANSILSNNSAQGGGGLFIQAGSAVTILNTSFLNNSTSLSGAGIYMLGGSLLIVGAVFSNNSASSAGGAVYLFDSDATIRNSTFCHNHAGSLGGALVTVGAAVQLLMQNCTIATNSASNKGGGIYRGVGVVTVESTIIGNNAASSEADVHGSITANNCLIGDTSGAAITGSNNKLNVDPLLDTLDDNGGPTQTILLLPGSPAIDAGSNPTGLDYDQRGPGFPRVINGLPDIGATEGFRTIPWANATSPNVTVVGGSSQSITVTYSGFNAINASTIGPDDITVTGPGGFTCAPTFDGVDDSTDGTPRVAIYHFTPPGGTWDTADNGDYTINMAANQVADISNSYVPAGPIGQFNVAAYVAKTYVVTTLADSGAGSLRQAIVDANANQATAADTITFGVTGTITLSSDLPQLEDGLTIEGPGAALLAITRSSGGRVLFAQGLTLSGITIKNIPSPFFTVGGGLALFTSGVSFIRDCVFSNISNINIGIFGGAVSVNGTVTIERCTFQNNSAIGKGAALGVGDGSTVIRACSFIGNQLADSTQSYYGGAVAQSSSANLTIEDSVFYGNSVGMVHAKGGGAIGMIGAGALTVRNSTFYSNQANSGGAIYADGTAFLQNCTITDNYALSQFQGNSGYGGGIAAAAGATIQLQSTIVSGNNDDDAPDIYFFGGAGTVQANHSAVGSATGIPTWVDQGGNLPFETDLQLGPFGYNGGPTQTRALLSGSPCINAGANPASLVNDQRGTGYWRTIGKSADIGAYEYQNLPPTVTALQINDGSAQRSRVTSLAVTFDRPVTLPGNPANAFQLVRQSPSGTVVLAASVTDNVVTLTFIGGPIDGASLADGRYTLTAWASQINGGVFDGDGNGSTGDDYQLIGNPTNKFFRLFGDSDGNGIVNQTDFIAFRNAFNNGPSAIFDFDGGGQVNQSDFIQFRTRFNTSI